MNCPNCKQPEHYGKCRFVYGRAVAPAAPVTCRECEALKLTVSTLQARVAELEGRLAANSPANTPIVSTKPANRNEYQREYMRRKRAQQK